ncbi:TRAP transporter permease [Planococcus salinus]|nr:TRAP transporter permease [Planococcus salinus]
MKKKQTTDNKKLIMLAAFVAVAMSVYQLYISLFPDISLMQQRAIHLGFGLVLTFLVTSFKKEGGKSNIDNAIKVLLISASIISIAYIYKKSETLIDNFGFPTTWDLIFGTLVILLSLEAARRVAGYGLPILTIIAISYVFLGPYLPGVFEHTGIQFERFISSMFLTTEGIFGSILGVSATFVFMFILFGAFLNQSGAGEFYIKFALAFVGRLKGGPAYVGVLGSALMGMVSGSGVANAATTGVFTIPLMKKVGFKPHFAGAVEALASTGGQIMPPVMGAAAFLMVDFLGVPYTSIIKAALIPALLFFITIFFMIYFETRKMNLEPVPEDQIPRLLPLLKEGFHHFLPPVVLVVLLTVFKYTPLYSAVITIGFIVAVSWLRKGQRMTPKQILNAMEDGARGSIVIVSLCALAGIIVGIINLTGLGLELSSMLIGLAGGSLMLLLVLTMFSSIVLGMGLPTTASYIILAILVAPALIDFGLHPIGSHLFVLYFGVLALVTPPIGACFYITAGIADANPLKTGMMSMKLGIAGYIAPFMFVRNEALLMIGSPIEILLALSTALIGTFALAAGAQNYLVYRTNILWRILLIGSSLMLIEPTFLTDLIGVGTFLAILIIQWINKKREVMKENRSLNEVI